jgi:hypothetical protein
MFSSSKTLISIHTLACGMSKDVISLSFSSMEIAPRLATPVAVTASLMCTTLSMCSSPTSSMMSREQPSATEPSAMWASSSSGMVTIAWSTLITPITRSFTAAIPGSSSSATRPPGSSRALKSSQALPLPPLNKSSRTSSPFTALTTSTTLSRAALASTCNENRRLR